MKNEKPTELTPKLKRLENQFVHQHVLLKSWRNNLFREFKQVNREIKALGNAEEKFDERQKVYRKHGYQLAKLNAKSMYYWLYQIPYEQTFQIRDKLRHELKQDRFVNEADTLASLFYLNQVRPNDVHYMWHMPLTRGRIHNLLRKNVYASELVKKKAVYSDVEYYHIYGMMGLETASDLFRGYFYLGRGMEATFLQYFDPEQAYVKLMNP